MESSSFKVLNEDQANTTMSCDLSAPNLGMGSDSIALEVVSNLSYPMTGF